MKEFIELTKDVLLIKNAVSDPNKLYEIIKKSKQDQVEYFGPWMDWKPWGFYSKIYPEVNQEWLTNEDYLGSYFIKQTIDAFWEAMSYYKENLLNKEYFDIWNESTNFPTSWDELVDKNKNTEGWSINDLLIAESINSHPKKNLSMEYHKDRRMWDTPHSLFFNYNIYINDDYEGGEIQFINLETAEESTYINKNGEEKKCLLVDDPITYKPKAGDAMLFRTDHAHGVLPIKGHKYYVRYNLVTPLNKKIKEIQHKENYEDILKEIEKDGFANKQWDGKVFGSKDTINSDVLNPRTIAIALKSGNESLIAKPYRYSYNSPDDYESIWETDPLYDYNERKPARLLEK
jgi:virulence-associated protein VapD